jgi:hypothetical protein
MPHTQTVRPVPVTDLTNSMVWVDGYGNHYSVEEVGPALLSTIADGYLSHTVDRERRTLRLRPLSVRMPDVTVTVHLTDVLDVLA